jgi:hypothetical protein
LEARIGDNMEINKDTLNKIGSMSNEQLKEVIAQITEALGATPMQKRMALNNASLIKRKLMGMSENELRNYLNKLPKDKKEELEKKIKL